MEVPTQCVALADSHGLPAATTTKLLIPAPSSICSDRRKVRAPRAAPRSPVRGKLLVLEVEVEAHPSAVTIPFLAVEASTGSR